MAFTAGGKPWLALKMNDKLDADCTIREFRFDEDYSDVIQLWQQAGDGVHIARSDAPQEILKKLQRDPDLFLIAEYAGCLIGSVIGGYDGRRGLIYHLAVAPEFRTQGIGSALMDEVEARLRGKGCLKCYLLVVAGNEPVGQFYARRGWQAMDVTVYGKELI